MKKRITSLILVLAICLMLLPAAAANAYNGYYGGYDEHTHYLCGAGSSSYGYYDSGSCTCSSKEASKTYFQTELTQNSDGTLKKGGNTWSAADNNYELKTGEYYLTVDLTLECGILITGDVKLCLNGHSITCDAGTSEASVPVITV